MNASGDRVLKPGGPDVCGTEAARKRKRICNLPLRIPFPTRHFPTTAMWPTFRWRSLFSHRCRPTRAAWACLAGDTLRSAADLGVPLAAFTLVHRKGYFEQHLSATGVQSEDVQPWNPADFCTEEAARVTVQMESRVVTVRAWRYDMRGQSGARGADLSARHRPGGEFGLGPGIDGPPLRRRHELPLAAGDGAGDGRRAHGPCAGPARERVPHERRPRGAADAGAAGKPDWAEGRRTGRPTRTSSRCGADACSRRTRRCRRGTTGSRPSSRFAFWAATGRRAWNIWDASATDC